MVDEPDAPSGDMDAAFEKAYNEAPGPSGAPASAGTDTPAPDAATPTQPDTGRNEKGQFTKRAEPSEALPQEATPDEQSETPPAEEVPTESTEAATEEAEVTYPEFTYRAAGREFNIPGSAVGEDGAYIPTAALPAITRLLAEGQHAKEGSREFARQLQTARSQGQQELQYARSLLASLNSLRQEGPDAIADWFADLDRNWPLMEANAKLSLLEQQRETERTQHSQVEQDRQAEALVPRLQGVLETTLAEYATRPEMAGVDTKRLYERLSGRLFDQVFEEATDDDVAQGIASHVGQVIVNYGVIEDEMKYEADILRRARESAVKTQKVTQQNANRTANANPPPTVGAKKGASQASGKQIPKFANAREADEWAFGDQD